jgi:pyruvate,orthophosphate dikinase
MVQSKALEINLADHHVDVMIDAKYAILQEIFSSYYGIMEGLNIFLKELSHPYRNWQFILKEARGYALDYFHLLKAHPQGSDGAKLLIEIFTSTIENSKTPSVRADAVDNLLLYLQKIIEDSDTQISHFMPVLNQAFKFIKDYDESTFFLFVKSFYQAKKQGEMLLQYPSDVLSDFSSINRLILKYFKSAYGYWLKEVDPLSWFKKEVLENQRAAKIDALFHDISHKQMKVWISQLNQAVQAHPIDSRESLISFLKFPGYNQIVEIYRNIPKRLFEIGSETRVGNHWKVLFLFHIMNVRGLSMIHEESLRDINLTLSWVIDHEKGWNIQKLLQQTFDILQDRGDKYPIAMLNGLLNMGKGVYKTDDSDLVQFFIDSLIELGFQTPKISGVGNDWQIKVNYAHILNLRTWLELVEIDPKRSIHLLSSLVIYLSLCGVFIKDTDLFPRDITRLLNSNIEPVYNLIKQLARLFPVFFNDIGAEGKLREISTRIDEISHRKDILVHFLRKQSHVESSNQIIDFMEATFKFWETGQKNHIKSFVPPSIFDQIDAKGPYIDGLHRIMTHLVQKGISPPKDLLSLQEEKVQQMLADVTDVPDADLERIDLAINFYKLLNQKYHLDFLEFDHYLAQLESEPFPNLHKISAALKEPNLKKMLFQLLEYLEVLKSIILSPKTYDVKEDIYKKRHFTVDIPSTYGSYHEFKFDAMGLAFRLESLVNVLFEELIQGFDFSLITKAAFYQVYDLLMLFYKAIKLDGIFSIEIERQSDLLSHSLEVKGFTFTQYLDIFKGLAQSVSNVINDYFNNIHEPNLTKILSRLPFEQLLPKYLPPQDEVDYEKLKHRVSEIFFRDRIALSSGLQQLDVFVSRILKTLFHQADKLPKETLHQLLLYDPEKVMMSISRPKSRVSGVIYLGNKGFNLVKLNNFNFPVPPGFIITTEMFRFRDVIDTFPPAEQNYKDQVYHHIAKIQKITGKSFGHPQNPLLVSIRSGSSISQPGMMDTFLNVGMNEEIAVGLAEKTGNEWFSWDCFRRFLQCYGMSFGIERDDFDAIIGDYKQKFGTPYKKGFSGQQMQEVALTYKGMVLDSGIQIVEDPFNQLMLIINRVFGSWDSSKAKTYRKILGISDDWGTAVTVQAMVFGNLSQHSGSGLIFTHNPRWEGDTQLLWGDFTLGNQGEDVASGLVNTLPISLEQQNIEMRDTDMTLETHFPEIFFEMEAWANDLICKKGWGHQEIEFTFESPSKSDLFLLQARDMGMRERETTITFDFSQIKEDQYLGHGIGAGGGAMSGRAVFTLEEIDKWRDLEPEVDLILIRGDTVPDDIREIYAANGILTARGGVTSHASVIAHQLGKTCVVGCEDLICNEKERTCVLNDRVIKSGDRISIDGLEGSVYHDAIKVKEQ